MRENGSQNARRLLRTLSYGQWLEAALAMPPKSMVRHSIRSLEQLAWLFRPVSSAYPFVDLHTMRDWVAQTVGDEELAARIDEVLRLHSGYKQRCLAIYEVLDDRCKTLQKLAGGEG